MQKRVLLHINCTQKLYASASATMAKFITIGFLLIQTVGLQERKILAGILGTWLYNRYGITGNIITHYRPKKAGKLLKIGCEKFYETTKIRPNDRYSYSPIYRTGELIFSASTD